MKSLTENQIKYYKYIVKISKDKNFKIPKPYDEFNISYIEANEVFNKIRKENYPIVESLESLEKNIFFIE